jgi:heme-degrading monooxygenase HmoA
MIIVLFRSRLTPEASNGYAEMAEQMSKLAQASPGFIAEKGFTAEDGERLTVVWWQDEETLKQWRNDGSAPGRAAGGSGEVV